MKRVVAMMLCALFLPLAASGVEQAQLLGRWEGHVESTSPSATRRTPITLTFRADWFVVVEVRGKPFYTVGYEANGDHILIRAPRQAANDVKLAWLTVGSGRLVAQVASHEAHEPLPIRFVLQRKAAERSQ